MKKINTPLPVLLTILVFNLGIASAWSETRTFTSTDGKTLRGVLLSVEEGKVTIKRSDGKIYTLAADRFSEEDQTFFKKFKNKPKPLPKLSLKDFKEHPYTTSFAHRKLDSGMEGIFDELKVTKGKRIRIHGKKKHDSGRVEGKVVYHLGKLVLFPAGTRSGTLTVKYKSLDDVRFYHMTIALKDQPPARKDALISRAIVMNNECSYKWSYTESEGKGWLKIEETSEEGVSIIGTLSASLNDIESIGFAATVRSIGNEADISITVDE